MTGSLASVAKADPAHPESFRAIADRERQKAGMTVEDFAFEVSRAAKAAGLGRSGASVSSIQKHLSGGLKSSPSVALMELAAERLGITPDAFAEYRLAKAREALDETVVGYEDALARLKRFEKAPRPAGRAADAGRGSRPGRAGSR